jgi:CDP-4-dehydro-6-deoxyglucose reductase
MPFDVLIEDVAPLTETIFRLYMNPEDTFTYQPGQYIEIMTPHGAFPFSIANAPLGKTKIELHIRHANDNPLNQWLLKTIREKGRWSISEAKGHCTLSCLKEEKPILFVAGGTGFSPIKAMLEQLLFEGDRRLIHFCWLANKKEDFYLDQTVKQWANHVENFFYTPLISSRNQTNLGLASVLKETYKKTVTQFQVVLAGPFELVFSLQGELSNLGIAKEVMYSDAFSFGG